MKCIHINSKPNGEAPLAIRQAWVGLTLPLVPTTNGINVGVSKGVLSGSTVVAMGYPVDSTLAHQILELHRPVAARWWQNQSHNFGDEVYVFGANCCTVVDGIPSIVSADSSVVAQTVSQFFEKLSERTSWEGCQKHFQAICGFDNPEAFETFMRSSITPAAVLFFMKEYARYESRKHKKAWETSRTKATAVHKKADNVLSMMQNIADLWGIKSSQKVAPILICYADQVVTA